MGRNSAGERRALDAAEGGLAQALQDLDAAGLDSLAVGDSTAFSGALSGGTGGYAGTVLRLSARLLLVRSTGRDAGGTSQRTLAVLARPASVSVEWPAALVSAGPVDIGRYGSVDGSGAAPEGWGLPRQPGLGARHPDWGFEPASCSGLWAERLRSRQPRCASGHGDTWRRRAGSRRGRVGGAAPAGGYVIWERGLGRRRRFPPHPVRPGRPGPERGPWTGSPARGWRPLARRRCDVRRRGRHARSADHSRHWRAHPGGGGGGECGARRIVRGGIDSRGVLGVRGSSGHGCDRAASPPLGAVVGGHLLASPEM